MPLEVIGAGFGRTGTLSLKHALEQLGFGPCHHMLEVFAHPEQVAGFAAAAAGEHIDWEVLLGGYRSAVDWPSAHFWRELAERYPSAKVILSTRPVDAWFESVSETIFRGFAAPVERAAGIGREHRAMVDTIIGKQTFGGRPLDAAHAKAVFLEHERTVRASLPPERLLVFEAGAGWAPLCSFLGVPAPDTPFPRANERQEFLARMAAMRAANGGRSAAT